MKVTIRDVARHAGVSVATVSRYLNNSPLIAPASVEKVQRSIRELDYQPSMAARSMVRGGTNTVALAVDYSNTETYGDEFFLRIQYGLEYGLAERGFYLMIVNVSGGDAAEVLRKLTGEGRVDGLVFLSELAHAGLTELLTESGLPFVAAGKMDGGEISWVDIDNAQGGALAARRLISGGARRVGYLGNSFGKTFVSERANGCRAALRETGCQVDEKDFADGLESVEEFERYFSSRLDSLCDGYVISDSTLCFNALRALRHLNVPVPERVGVVTFDNQRISELSEPPMTVVDTGVAKIGEKAAEILVRQIRGELDEPERCLLSVELIERGSAR